MTPFVTGLTVQLFYYPLLAWWAYAYLRLPFLLYPILGVLLLGFFVQLWCVQGKHPAWADHASPFLQLLGLAPLLLYASHLPVLLFSSLLPALLIGQREAWWGSIVLLLLVGTAVLGSWMGGTLALDGGLLAVSGGIAFVVFLAILPSLEGAKKALKRYAVVEELGGLFEGASDRQAILCRLIERMTAIVGTEFGAIYLLDDKQGKLILQVSAGKEFEHIKDNLLELATGTLDWVAKEGKVYVANDLSLDPRYAHYWQQQHKAVASLACVPIGRPPHIKGALVCGATMGLTASFSETNLAFLTLFCRYISLVLEQDSLRRIHQHLLRELEALHAGCSALNSSLGLDEILHLIAGLTSQVLDVKEWTLFLFDPGTKTFYGYLSTTAFMEEIHGLRITWGEGAISQSVIRKETLVIPDLSKNPLVSEKENRGGRFLSMMVIPLFKGETTRGVIQVSDLIPRTFSDEEVRFATSFAALVALALERFSPGPA